MQMQERLEDQGRPLLLLADAPHSEEFLQFPQRHTFLFRQYGKNEVRELLLREPVLLVLLRNVATTRNRKEFHRELTDRGAPLHASKLSHLGLLTIISRRAFDGAP